MSRDATHRPVTNAPIPTKPPQGTGSTPGPSKETVQRDYLWEQLVQLEDRLSGMPPAARGREVLGALKAVLDNIPGAK